MKSAECCSSICTNIYVFWMSGWLSKCFLIKLSPLSTVFLTLIRGSTLQLNKILNQAESCQSFRRKYVKPTQPFFELQKKHGVVRHVAESCSPFHLDVQNSISWYLCMFSSLTICGQERIDGASFAKFSWCLSGAFSLFLQFLFPLLIIWSLWYAMVVFLLSLFILRKE